MNKFIKNIPLMAFVLGLGLIIAMSSFKAVSEKQLPITYHISGFDINGDYIVTTGGSCDPEPVADCQFMSDLLPDANGVITKDRLLEENPAYTVQKGTYVP